MFRRIKSSLRSSSTRKGRFLNRLHRSVVLEPLEDRRLLAVFHVALTGSDANTGGVADPFRTIQAGINAAAVANDGADTVNVAGGDYNTLGTDEGITIPNDAELDNLSILGGFNAAFTVRDTFATPTNYTPSAAAAFVTINDSDTTIDGISFDFVNSTTPARGIDFTTANGVTLSDLSVTNAPNDGIGGSAVSGLVLDRVDSSNNALRGLNTSNLTGTTTVLSSTFSNNGSNGAIVDGTAGSSLLLDVNDTASGNTGAQFFFRDFRRRDRPGHGGRRYAGHRLYGRYSSRPGTTIYLRGSAGRLHV